MLKLVSARKGFYSALAALIFALNVGVTYVAAQVGGGAANGGAASGQAMSNGPAPALSSCGTGPVFVGGAATNAFGTITEGTSGTGCTLTWTTPRTGPPVCIVVGRTSGLLVTALTVASATTLTWTNASGAGVYDYICSGT